MLVVVSFAPAGRFPPQSSPAASPAPLVILISVSQSVSVVTGSEEHGPPPGTTQPHNHTTVPPQAQTDVMNYSFQIVIEITTIQGGHKWYN